MLIIKEKIRKINQYFKIVSGLRQKKIAEIGDILYLPCDYKTDNTLPTPDTMQVFPENGVWGEEIDSHAWFYLKTGPVLPGTFLKVETERNGWDADNPQFLAYVNGKMRQGLDTNHRELFLESGKPLEIYLYAYSGPRISHLHLYTSLDIFDPDADGLYYDMYYPLEMLQYLGEETNEYAKITDYLFKAVSLLKFYDFDSDEAKDSIREAHEFMQNEFYGKYCHAQDTTVTGIGHTHIDCAWRWTLKQTREKVQRSFTTVLTLMDQYPEYKFMSSQVYLYKALKEEAPEVFERVKERIKEGRWECEGAMWVEPDCNLPSGESLVRQVLYGKKYMRKNFGVESKILWLPDVFGYSAALPQILKKSGVDWFVTSKISWNDVNMMPYDTFKWQGIDGTEINSYFLTAQSDKGTPSRNGTTYNAKTNSPEVNGTFKRYQQKDLSSEALITFGYGDGGGGPTREYLELGRRGAKGVPGSPNFRIDTAGHFLDRLADNMEKNGNVPKWQGELYLEYHRGTYTTQDANKKNNRRAEFLYEKAEEMSIFGEKYLGVSYPKDALYEGWTDILTHQFHDILPGSSIAEVYADSDIAYKKILGTAEGIVNGIEEKLAEKFSPENGVIVWNATSFETEGVVKLGGKTAKTAEKIPPMGYLVTDKFVKGNNVSFDGKTVESSRLRVTLDKDGHITSIYDKKADREILRAGEACGLRVYPDYPDKYDAWEWQSYCRDEFKTLSNPRSIEVSDDGVRLSLTVFYDWGKASTVEEKIFFDDASPKIDFEVKLDWHEKHQMLKAYFPVDINADKATFEIQFGNIERPTHFNTGWDRAKFETCGHKYADLSDGGYGVSIINDCKYGHDIHDGNMLLSLHRSPSDPAPHSGEGVFTMAYSLLLHEGRLADSDTLKEAYLLNQPMKLIAPTGEKSVLPLSYSMISLDKENVVCETVKKAEDDDATVVRLFEAMNVRGSVTVTLGIPFKKVVLCDLQEKPIKEIAFEGNSFRTPIKGFEILTFKVYS